MSSSKKKSSSKKNKTDKIKSGLSCNISQQDCEKSRKYKKSDIVALALQCGVDTKGSRKEICARIAAAISNGVVPKVSSPKDITPTMPTPTPKLPTPQPEGDCYGGGNYDDLLSKKVAELRQLLDKAGVKAGRPSKKAEMAQYLCDIAQNPRCDPEAGVDCEGNQVCDASNKPGVCISPELANIRGYDEMMWGNRRVIGTKAALKVLKNKLGDNKLPIPKTITPMMPKTITPPIPKTITPPIPKTITPPIPKTPTPPIPKTPTPTVPKTRPPEGTEVVDIEEILKQIQQGTGEEIGDLAATQREVLKCLGLLGS